MQWSITSIFLGLASVALAASSAGNRLLVVLEDLSQQKLYSQLWTDLKSRGYSVDIQSPKSNGLSLFRLDERVCDHVLLLPPIGKAYGSALTPQILLEFMKKDGNILLALTAERATPVAITALLLELKIYLSPDKQSLVVDHFNFDADTAAETHDVLVVPPPNPIRPDVKNFFAGQLPIAMPRAVAQVLGNDSPLLAPILRAPSTAYVYNPKEDVESVEDLFATGSQISLVTAFQALNSARFTVLGSAEALQDSWFDAQVRVGATVSKIGNKQFAGQLTSWAFQETGVLKVGRLQHHLTHGASSLDLSHQMLNGTGHLVNPSMYRIKNDVTFSIEISEWVKDRLQPYLPPVADAIQLEFTMLSPFHRLSLSPIQQTANSTIYSTSFTIPDQHGIFNFRVNYKRPFLTNLDEKRQVTVRHFAHDEWPRSWRISGAWTWISGLWVTIIGWLAFVALWLWSAPSTTNVGDKKTL